MCFWHSINKLEKKCQKPFSQQKFIHFLPSKHNFLWHLISKIAFQLSEVYRNSLLGDAFDRIEIEAFSKGSVLVDYYIYFKNFEEQVSTSDLKIVLNQQLEDPLGQPRLGRFRIDPNYTDFIGKHILFFLCKVDKI